MEETSRTCWTCGEIKPLIEYHPYAKPQVGRNRHCKVCVNRKHREWYAAGSPSKVVPTTKVCVVCKAEKPVEDFPHNQIKKKVGRKNICLNCYYVSWQIPEAKAIPNGIPSDAYFAGHFDAEGCVIMVSERTSRPTLQVSVTNTYLPILEAYAERFGSSVTAQKNTKNKPLFNWQTRNIACCLSLLSAIQPYSIEKQEQVKAALDYCEYRITLSKGSRSLELCQRAEDLLLRLRSLKRVVFEHGTDCLTPPMEIPADYFAGQFDGDGCILMRSSGHKRPNMQISITAAHLPTLHHYKDKFGGSVYIKKSKYSRKPLHYWVLTNNDDSSGFLKAIVPFSVEKREQLKIALGYLEYRDEFGKYDYSPEITARAVSTLERLRELKRT